MKKSYDEPIVVEAPALASASSSSPSSPTTQPTAQQAASPVVKDPAPASSTSSPSSPTTQPTAQPAASPVVEAPTPALASSTSSPEHADPPIVVTVSAFSPLPKCEITMLDNWKALHREDAALADRVYIAEVIVNLRQGIQCGVVCLLFPAGKKSKLEGKNQVSWQLVKKVHENGSLESSFTKLQDYMRTEAEEFTFLEHSNGSSEEDYRVVLCHCHVSSIPL